MTHSLVDFCVENDPQLAKAIFEAAGISNPSGYKVSEVSGSNPFLTRVAYAQNHTPRGGHMVVFTMADSSPAERTTRIYLHMVPRVLETNATPR